MPDYATVCDIEVSPTAPCPANGWSECGAVGSFGIRPALRVLTVQRCVRGMTTPTRAQEIHGFRFPILLKNPQHTDRGIPWVSFREGERNSFFRKLISLLAVLGHNDLSQALTPSCRLVHDADEL